DEFAANFSVAIDDVGFGKLEGSVKCVGLVGGIAHGGEFDVMIADEGVVSGIVDVGRDAEDDDVGHVFLQGDEGGHFFDAGGTPGRPEVEDDDFAAVIGEGNGVVRVGYGELRRLLAELGGTGSLVAGGKREGQQGRQKIRKAGHEHIIDKQDSG